MRRAHHHRRRHRVADHHPGQRDDGAALGREDPEPEHHREAHRRDREHGHGAQGPDAGHLRARLRTVMPAKTIITATHNQAHATDASGSSTSFRAHPTTNSWASGPDRGPQDRAGRGAGAATPRARTATPMRTREAASPAHPIWVSVTCRPSRRRRRGSGSSPRDRRCARRPAPRPGHPAGAPGRCRGVTHRTPSPASASSRASTSTPRRFSGSSDDVGSSINRTSGPGEQGPGDAHALRLTAGEVVPDAVEHLGVESDPAQGVGEGVVGGVGVGDVRGSPGRSRRTRPGPGTPCPPSAGAPGDRGRRCRSPSNRTTPAEGTSRRLPSRSRVDLPAPDGPASTVTRPGHTAASTPCRSSTPSSVVTRTPSNDRTGSVGSQRVGGHGVSMTPARPAS